MKEIIGVYHIACLNHWKFVFEQQIERLDKLILKSNKLYLSIYYSTDEDIEFINSKISKYPNVKIEFKSNKNLFEFPALQIIKKIASKIDCYIYYIHTKGVSINEQNKTFYHGSTDLRHLINCVEDWRKYMEEYIIDKHEECIKLLASHDVVGVNLRLEPTSHFSGNFWWSKSEWINKLPEIKDLNITHRWSAEFWIGMNKGEFYSMHDNNAGYTERLNMNKIPKIIHQIWLGDKSLKPTRLMQTWQDMNPTWEYKLWSEENLPELKCQKQFNEMREYCGKADILRYEILSKFGGFYIDADSECINSLDDSFIYNDSFAGYENEQVRPGLVANGYLASIPNNELINYMINKISMIDNINHNAPWIVTGPQLLTNSIKELNYDKIRIYPSYVFIPKHLTGLTYNGIEKSYAMQYWGSTLGYNKIK